MNSKLSAWKKLALHDVTLGCVLSALLATMAVNRLAPDGINADTILQSIMSLQNVTPFVWGQDRFANVVPFSLSWITSPRLNLVAHLFVYSFAFFAFLIFATLWASRSALVVKQRQDQWLAVAIVLAICLACIGTQAINAFATEVQPYALSCLFALAAIALLRVSASLAAIALALILIVLAMGLNPSLLLFLAPAALYIFFVMRRRREAVILASGTAAAFAFWTVLAAGYPSPPKEIGYGIFSLATVHEDLSRAASSIIAALRTPVLGAAAFTILAISLVRVKREPQNIARRSLSAVLAIIAIGWWMLFGVNAWVKANASHFRYFFPSILALCFLLAIHIQSQFLRASNAAKYAAMAFCACVGAYFLVAYPTRIASYGAMQATAPYATYAAANGISLVAGNYWFVWPTVFQLMHNRKTAFGITYRGDANARAVRRWVAEQSAPLMAICVQATPAQCTGELERITGRKWTPSPNVCPHVACSVMASNPAP